MVDLLSEHVSISNMFPNQILPFPEKQEYLVHLFKLVSKLWIVNQQTLDVSEFETNISGKLNFVTMSKLNATPYYFSNQIST
jgi:hypothetical protein